MPIGKSSRRKAVLNYLQVLALLVLVCAAALAQNEDAGPTAPGEVAAIAEGVPPAAEEAPPDISRAPARTEGVSIRQVIVWGGYVGYFIIFLSVVTLTLVAFHCVSLRKAVMFPNAVCARVGALIRDRKLKDVLEFLKGDRSLISRILSAGLSRIRGGYAEMEQIMADVTEDEAMRLEQGVGYFSLIAVVAPLCGLLGTVIGMIAAFHEISVLGVVTPKELADPIQKALVTTCFGLIVAIPNVVAYALFHNRLRRLLAELSVEVEEVMIPLRGLKPMPTGLRPTSVAAPQGDEESKEMGEEESDQTADEDTDAPGDDWPSDDEDYSDDE
jgi:biopolymer transport protein ExbB